MRATTSEFLIGSGLEEASLHLSSGEVRTGEDLRRPIDDALVVRGLLNGLHSRYSRAVVEQAAIAGALNPEVVADLGRADAMAKTIAARLDAIAEDMERGWEGRTSTSNEGPGGYRVRAHGARRKGIRRSSTWD